MRNYVKLIVKNVNDNVYPGYSRSFNSTWIYKLEKGRTLPYNVDKSLPGVTLRYTTMSNGTTVVYYPEITDDLIDLVQHLEDTRFELHEQQSKLNKHISEEYYGQ